MGLVLRTTLAAVGCEVLVVADDKAFCSALRVKVDERPLRTNGFIVKVEGLVDPRLSALPPGSPRENKQR